MGIRKRAPLRGAWLAGALLLLLAFEAPAAEPKRVLLLNSLGAAFAPFSAVASQFREDLIKNSPGPIDFYEVSLEAARFRESEEDEAPLADHLRALFRDRSLDLVVVNGGPANRFFQRYRSALFPSVPLLITGIEQRYTVETENDTVVSVSFSVSTAVDAVLKLLPRTENIAVVIGNSPLEKAWVREIERDFQPFQGRVKFLWLNGLSFAQIRERVATLPPHSATFYFALHMDGEGVPYDQDRPLRALHQVANAPIFGMFDNMLGLGVVGGPMIASREVGRRAASAAVRILAGEKADDIRMSTLLVGAPTYDWRELQRWNISEASLPANSIVEFKGPTVWEQYRWQLLAVLIAILVQAGVISWLLFERHLRRNAEKESHGRMLEVVHLNRTATVGALSASVAHELNQPLGAILSNAEAAEKLLSSGAASPELLREILFDIRRDDERAGEIIRRLRGLLRKSELNFQEFELDDEIRDVVRILEGEAKKRGVQLDATLGAEDAVVSADKVHLQQVMLNVAINGMDAMVNSDAQKRLSFQSARNGSSVEVMVADNGCGIPEGKLSSVFDTFYTTKPNGTGLGLSIARTIIETYGGRIWAENRVGGGAAFRFTLPLQNAQAK